MGDFAVVGCLLQSMRHGIVVLTFFLSGNSAQTNQKKDLCFVDPLRLGSRS
jgi:hypothetical protein